MGHGIDTKRDFHLGLAQAWHGLTRVVPTISREMLPEIVRLPLSYTLPDGTVRAWDGITVPVSGDDGLPVGVSSGDSYTTFGPREGLDHVAEVLSGTRFTISSAGMIFNRSRWFLSVDLDELREVSRDGEKFHLVWSGGLAKNQTPSCDLSHVRAVCANTVRMARENGENLFSGRLTRNFASGLDQSRGEIERAVGMARIFNAALGSLEQTRATVDEARTVYAGELTRAGASLTSTRGTNILDGMVSTFQRGLGNEGRTRADVFHGFTQFLGRGAKDSKKDAFGRWVSSEFGTFADRKTAFARDLTSETGWDRLRTEGAEALADARKGAVTV